MEDIERLYHKRELLENRLNKFNEKVKQLPHLSNGLLADEVREENIELLDNLDTSFKQLRLFNDRIDRKTKKELVKFKRSIQKNNK